MRGAQHTFKLKCAMTENMLLHRSMEYYVACVSDSMKGCLSIAAYVYHVTTRGSENGDAYMEGIVRFKKNMNKHEVERVFRGVFPRKGVIPICLDRQLVISRGSQKDCVNLTRGVPHASANYLKTRGFIRAKDTGRPRRDATTKTRRPQLQTGHRPRPTLMVPELILPPPMLPVDASNTASWRSTPHDMMSPMWWGEKKARAGAESV
jgi:hypothetical protein